MSVLVSPRAVRKSFYPLLEEWALNRTEYMVGMSGKVSEPRRGQASQTKKAAVGSVSSGGSNKTQPPPEALHVANILGDGMYPELGEKMAQVMAICPTRSEEEVCIALHDHDYDTAKAITALLDTDSQSSSQVCRGEMGGWLRRFSLTPHPPRPPG